MDAFHWMILFYYFEEIILATCGLEQKIPHAMVWGILVGMVDITDTERDNWKPAC